MDGRTSPNIKGAHALGCIEFMAGNGKQVDLIKINRNFHFATGLCSVTMHQRAGAMSRFRNLPNGLECPGLAVGVHDRDQDSLLA